MNKKFPSSEKCRVLLNFFSLFDICVGIGNIFYYVTHFNLKGTHRLSGFKAHWVSRSGRPVAAPPQVSTPSCIPSTWLQPTSAKDGLVLSIRLLLTFRAFQP